MKKILLSITLIVCFAAISQKSMAQYILKQADEEYKLFNYTKAVGLYLKAYEKKKTYYTANHIANSYRVMQDYAQTETWYAIVVAMPEATPDDINKYAEALRNNAKYEEAKVQYTRYYTLKKELNKNQLKVLLASCDSAVRWMKSPKPVEVTNEQLLNTANSDWGSALYQGNLVFASDRNTRATSKADEKKPLLKFDNEKLPDTKTYEWTGNNYVKLYEAVMGDSAKRFPLVTGTDYHVGPATFTADGNEMYFTITRPNKNWDKDTSAIKTFTLEIYSSKKVNNAWGKPVAFKYNNPKWSVGDPFVTPDGKKLYFVSNMPDGVGGTDIYYSLRDASGNWNLPVNLKAVNTQGNERTPVVDSVNTIYFSSDSGIGMGGLDIFKAIPSGDTYGVRQNLGFPVNSPRDDLAYVLTSPTTGYFSSNRAGGVGSDDIYSFKQKAVLQFKLQGIVYDKATRRPVANSTVSLNNNKVVTNATGAFNFTLAENSDYRLRGEKPGYLSDNQSVTTKGLTTTQTIKKDLYIEAIVLNKAIRLENIYYDFDKSNIRPDAAVELDKLIKILNDNPNISIELGSHTDSKGNDEYNQALSQRRANAAVDYIITNGGIDEERIVARGYGETRLLNRCTNGVNCSPAEHQLNRRTEFKIIKM